MIKILNPNTAKAQCWINQYTYAVSDPTTPFDIMQAYAKPSDYKKVAWSRIRDDFYRLWTHAPALPKGSYYPIITSATCQHFTAMYVAPVRDTLAQYTLHVYTAHSHYTIAL